MGLVLPVAPASSSGASAHLIASLLLTSALSKGLPASRPFIRSLGQAMFLSCSCMCPLQSGARLWWPLLMKLRPGLGTLSMVVLPTSSLFSNRYVSAGIIIMWLAKRILLYNHRANMRGEKIIKVHNPSYSILIVLFVLVDVFGFNPNVDLLLHSPKLIFSSDRWQWFVFWLILVKQ